MSCFSPCRACYWDGQWVDHGDDCPPGCECQSPNLPPEIVAVLENGECYLSRCVPSDTTTTSTSTTTTTTTAPPCGICRFSWDATNRKYVLLDSECTGQCQCPPVPCQFEGELVELPCLSDSQAATTTTCGCEGRLCKWGWTESAQGCYLVIEEPCPGDCQCAPVDYAQGSGQYNPWPNYPPSEDQIRYLYTPCLSSVEAATTTTFPCVGYQRWRKWTNYYMPVYQAECCRGCVAPSPGCATADSPLEVITPCMQSTTTTECGVCGGQCYWVAQYTWYYGNLLIWAACDAEGCFGAEGERSPNCCCLPPQLRPRYPNQIYRSTCVEVRWQDCLDAENNLIPCDPRDTRPCSHPGCACLPVAHGDSVRWYCKRACCSGDPPPTTPYPPPPPPPTTTTTSTTTTTTTTTAPPTTTTTTTTTTSTTTTTTTTTEEPTTTTTTTTTTTSTTTSTTTTSTSTTEACEGYCTWWCDCTQWVLDYDNCSGGCECQQPSDPCDDFNNCDVTVDYPCVPTTTTEE